MVTDILEFDRLSYSKSIDLYTWTKAITSISYKYRIGRACVKSRALVSVNLGSLSSAPV